MSSFNLMLDWLAMQKTCVHLDDKMTDGDNLTFRQFLINLIRLKQKGEVSIIKGLGEACPDGFDKEEIKKWIYKTSHQGHSKQTWHVRTADYETFNLVITWLEKQEDFIELDAKAQSDDKLTFRQRYHLAHRQAGKGSMAVFRELEHLELEDCTRNYINSWDVPLEKPRAMFARSSIYNAVIAILPEPVVPIKPVIGPDLKQLI